MGSDFSSLNQTKLSPTEFSIRVKKIQEMNEIQQSKTVQNMISELNNKIMPMIKGNANPKDIKAFMINHLTLVKTVKASVII